MATPALVPAQSSHPVNGMIGRKVELFDERPIELDGFTLRPYAIDPVGSPGIDQWARALLFVGAAHEHAPYWVGELLAYSDTREDWRDKIDQAMTVTGLARHTLINLASMVRKVDRAERALSPSVEHTKAVTSLPAPKQREMLEQATSHGWTSKQLQQAVRSEKRSNVVLRGRAGTMHTIHVLVSVSMEGSTPHRAEVRALEEIKEALTKLKLKHCKAVSSKVVAR